MKKKTFEVRGRLMIEYALLCTALLLLAAGCVKALGPKVGPTAYATPAPTPSVTPANSRPQL